MYIRCSLYVQLRRCMLPEMYKSHSMRYRLSADFSKPLRRQSTSPHGTPAAQSTPESPLSNPAEASQQS